MTKPKITRRGFLKLAGASAASTAVLTGCGPASRYVVREPYANMPEYTYNGESTYYATTCQECAAGCGIVVRTTQGRAIKVEGNPLHPVNAGKTCARGQASIQGLYNPDRVPHPINQSRSQELSNERIAWDEAINIVREKLQSTQPGQVAFMMGTTHDHLADLFYEILSVHGSSHLYRISPSSTFEAKHTAAKASDKFLENPSGLSYDIENADLILSFGANFLETWDSPVSYTRQYAAFRRGKKGKRGKFIQFEPRMSQTASVADEWIPIIPGTENLIALALGRLISEAIGQLPDQYAEIDPAEYAEMAGVDYEKLSEIATSFVDADAPLALPGGLASSQPNGVENLLSVLSLNALAISNNKPSLVFSTPSTIFETNNLQSTSMDEITGFIDLLQSGEIKTLFIHNANPLFDIPASFNFKKALSQVETIISFSSFPDETALHSDYIFPDHTNLESWGYQRVNSGVIGETISGLQPVVVPFFETRSTVDVFLSAIQQIGGDLASSLPFEDEVAYLTSKLTTLVGAENSLIRAGEAKTFMAQFQQYGGWWFENDQREPLMAKLSPGVLSALNNQLEENEFYLHLFISPILGDKGANKPWLQETPDPTTTVMWNTWIEIHPETAKELGIHDDDVVRLSTASGEIEASVYLYPGIRPDTIAVPFGQGHTAYGRYAQDRGANPFDLLGTSLNTSGDIVLSPIKVNLEKTGEHKQLARLESRIGVYGFDDH
jgi:anaerobic selenocysteine-containing dehydrogenase